MRWYNHPMFSVTEEEYQKQGHFVAGSLKLIFGFFIFALIGFLLGLGALLRDFVLGIFILSLFFDIIAILFFISGIKHFIEICRIKKK